MTKSFLLPWILTLAAAPALAEEPSFTIRNTDVGFAGQGVCTFVFTLQALSVVDNPVEIEVDFLENGEKVGNSVIAVEPFGQSRANQTQTAIAEYGCFDVSQIRIVRAWEIVNGKRLKMPLSHVHPDYYRPLEIVK